MKRIALIWTASLGVIYFTFGLYMMARLMIAVPEARKHDLLYTLPYLMIWIALAVSTAMAVVRKTRVAAVILALCIVVSGALCWYDISHHRCQIIGGGYGCQYLIWWWYSEPYWYGYKPGNV